MKTVLKSLALAALLSTFGPVLARADGCPGGMPTERAFFEQVEKNKQKPFTLTESGHAKFRIGYAALAKREVPAGAKLYFAPVNPGTSGLVIMVGGCVMPRTVEVVPSEMLAALLLKFGIAADEIVEYQLGVPA